jgi:AcrR family transcriptional regulator
LAITDQALGHSDSEVRKKIIAAARQCFARYGPRRATMEDVAAAAGIGRPALYRYVASRDELIECVILERMEELAESFRAVIENASSFAEGFVEVSLAAVESARNDPELQALFETTTGTRIIQVVAGPQPAFHDFVKAFFAEGFAAARASGQLRADVSDDALVEWIRGIYLMMILREDLDPDQEREMVRTFLLPSLMASGPTPTDDRSSRRRSPRRTRAES